MRLLLHIPFGDNYDNNIWYKYNIYLFNGMLLTKNLPQSLNHHYLQFQQIGRYGTFSTLPPPSSPPPPRSYAQVIETEGWTGSRCQKKRPGRMIKRELSAGERTRICTLTVRAEQSRGALVQIGARRTAWLCFARLILSSPIVFIYLFSLKNTW